VQTTLPVDGQGAAFKICDLGDGYWAAVGRVTDAVVSLDSRGVHLSVVGLERLASGRRPPPSAPDLDEQTEAVMRASDGRFARLPFERVRRLADYWALRSVEEDHVKRLAQRENLSQQQFEAVRNYWLKRVEATLSDTMEELHFRGIESHTRSGAERRLRPVVVAQLWFDTFGPGGRTCWQSLCRHPSLHLPSALATMTHVVPVLRSAYRQRR
jgi:sporulation protein YlmC with PRC-barrel domain